MLGISDEEIMANILQRLANKGYWAHGHTRAENAIKGFPSHEKGRAKKVLEDLVRINWVIKKPTGHGTDVHLNILYRDSIFNFIRKYSLP